MDCLLILELCVFLCLPVFVQTDFQWKGIHLNTYVQNINNEIRVVATVSDVDLEGCINKCQRRHVCQYINYNTLAHVCYLVEQLSAHLTDGNKIYGINFVFGQKSEWTNDNPPCNNCNRESCTDVESVAVNCECPVPPVISGARLLGNSYTVGSRLLYQCNNNPSRSNGIVCQADGTWSPVDLTCTNSGGQSTNTVITTTQTIPTMQTPTTTALGQTTTQPLTTGKSTIPTVTTGQTNYPTTTKGQATTPPSTTGQTTSTTGQTTFPTTTTGQITTQTTTTGRTTTATSTTGQTTTPTSTTGQTTISTSTTGQTTIPTSTTGQTTTPTSTTGQTTSPTSTMGQTTTPTSTTGQTTTPTSTTGQTTTPTSTKGQTTTPTSTTGLTTSPTSTTRQTTTPTSTTGRSTTPTSTTGQTTNPTSTTGETTTPTSTTGQTTTPTSTTGQTTTPTTTMRQITTPTSTTGQTTTPTSTTGQTTTPTSTTGQITTPTTTMRQITTLTSTTGQITTLTSTTGQTITPTSTTGQITTPTTTMRQITTLTSTTGQTTSPTSTTGQTTTPTTTMRQIPTPTSTTGQTTTPTSTTGQTTTPITTMGQTTVPGSSPICPIDTMGKTISYESVYLSNNTLFQFSVVNERATQSNALLCCTQSYDGSLVKILTAAKMIYLMAYLKEQNYDADFWIDARQTEGVWLTSDGQSVMSESIYWKGNGLTSVDSQFCTRMDRNNNFMLRDKGCTYQCAFICEKTIGQTTIPTTKTAQTTTPTTSNVPTPTPSPTCPIVTSEQSVTYNSVTLNDGRQNPFMLVNEPVTQSNALLCCTQRYDGRLVKILTAQKMVFLMEYLKAQNSGSSYWIDAKKVDGLWVTSDGHAVLSKDTGYWDNAYTNANAVCTRMEHSNNYYLNDVKCDKLYAFICEKF